MPPSAVYKSSITKAFTIDTSAPLTTNGKTTGPSEFVLSRGAVDRDRPSDAKDTELGLLRCHLTSLQDDINEFLTQRMKEHGDAGEKEFEKKLLDGDDDDDDA